MTRKSCVSAGICGSHIRIVQPSEFDSIKVGPLSRPSTETLSRQPSASIIGMVCFRVSGNVVRHCEERNDEAIHAAQKAGLLRRFAPRNDGTHDSYFLSSEASSRSIRVCETPW